MNICSVKNKIEELEHVLGNKYDIACIVEHFLNHEEAKLYCLQNYYIASCYSRIQNKHGGAMILCKNKLLSKTVENIDTLSNEMNCEVAAVELDFLNCIIVTIYRPPSGDLYIFLDIIEQILIVTLNLNRYVIINGDFNFNFINPDYRCKLFLDLISSFGFSQEIFEKNGRKIAWTIFLSILETTYPSKQVYMTLYYRITVLLS